MINHIQLGDPKIPVSDSEQSALNRSWSPLVYSLDTLFE